MQKVKRVDDDTESFELPTSAVQFGLGTTFEVLRIDSEDGNGR